MRSQMGQHKVMSYLTFIFPNSPCIVLVCQDGKMTFTSTESAVTAIISFALLSATPALAHADEVHVHIGTLLDYVDISTYQQVCAKIARTPNTRVDQIATVNGTEIPFSFRWQCIGHQLFLNDGGEACMDADNPIRCIGEPAKTGWIRVTTQEPPAPRAPPAAALPNPFSALLAAPPPPQASPAARLPREALKAYCAVAGDTMPAVFGDGRTGPPIVWRCVKSAVYTCEAGADGVACSARSHSRVPLPSMVEACRDGDNLSVASGAYGYVWDWECRGGKPVIAGPLVVNDIQTGTTTPAKFDAQGYAEGEWKPLD